MVSIIVPLYYGRKYLDSIIEQVENCAMNVPDIDVELILYNDSPNETIAVGENDYHFSVKVYNSVSNRGIHGARVQGLEYALGEYILFLDQDDRISPEYLKEQLESIGDSDISVCRLIHDQRLYYTKTHEFKKVISKEFMLCECCSIISPGQALIRKSSIPEFWKNNILVHNGADDYFLWLTMFCLERKFSLNQSVLFEHVVSGSNTSNNSNEMMDSEEEMIRLLVNSDFVSKEDKQRLIKLPEALRRKHVRDLDICKSTFSFLQQWNRKCAYDKSPLSFFYEKGISSVAIYGAGVMGRNIKTLLEGSGINLVCYIDQNAGYIISDIPVYPKENVSLKMDAVILTIRDGILKRELNDLLKCDVYYADEIVY